jgi:hypothetical protein
MSSIKVFKEAVRHWPSTILFDLITNEEGELDEENQRRLGNYLLSLILTNQGLYTSDKLDLVLFSEWFTSLLRDFGRKLERHASRYEDLPHFPGWSIKITKQRSLYKRRKKYVLVLRAGYEDEPEDEDETEFTNGTLGHEGYPYDISEKLTDALRDFDSSVDMSAKKWQEYECDVEDDGGMVVNLEQLRDLTSKYLIMIFESSNE